MEDITLPDFLEDRGKRPERREAPADQPGGLKDRIVAEFAWGGPLTLKDLYTALPGWKGSSVRKTVYSMLDAGELEKVRRGVYVAASESVTACPGEGESALYRGDSLKLLPLLAREGFRADLLCTDPPYNISDSASVIKRGRRGKYRGKDISPRFDFDHGLVEPEDWVPLAVRCLKEDAVFVAFLGARQLERVAGLLEGRGLKVKQFTGYFKRNPVPQARKAKWCSGIEHVLIAARGDYHYDWRQGYHPGYLESPVCMGKERLGHPTQKPLKVVEELVKWWSFVGDTVLDPFMGVGTTGVAALRNGRRFVGIELEERWYNGAKKRISRTSPVKRPPSQARLAG